MGNDGGSIPKRREVVREKHREERKENYEIAKAKARLCSLTKEPLGKHLFACRLGLLYNKEELVKRMLEKTLPKAFRHIRKLKDVQNVKATFKDNDGEQIIVCPVSQREMNGFHPFVIIWGCGCLISEEACKELKIADACLSCSHKITNAAEIVSLNQSPEQ